MQGLLADEIGLTIAEVKAKGQVVLGNLCEETSLPSLIVYLEEHTRACPAYEWKQNQAD